MSLCNCHPVATPDGVLHHRDCDLTALSAMTPEEHEGAIAAIVGEMRAVPPTQRGTRKGFALRQKREAACWEHANFYHAKTGQWPRVWPPLTVLVEAAKNRPGTWMVTNHTGGSSATCGFQTEAEAMTFGASLVADRIDRGQTVTLEVRK